MTVDHLTVLYGRRPALWDLSFTIPQRVLAGIIGPNGAGKSTLIKSILGLTKKQAGSTLIFNGQVQENLRRVAYVPQKETVDWDFPASVYDVVMMGRYGRMGLFKRPSKKDRDVVRACIEQVGMQSLSKRQIAQLSGGQQQRVFLARSLAQEADLYFMDEPFAGIDINTENMMLNLLKRLTQEGKTVIIVFHNIHRAAEYFEWLLLLNKRLIACGKTQEVFTKENIEETYGGELNFLTKVEQLAQPVHFRQPGGTQ